MPTVHNDLIPLPIISFGFPKHMWLSLNLPSFYLTSINIKYELQVLPGLDFKTQY